MTGEFDPSSMLFETGALGDPFPSLRSAGKGDHANAGIGDEHVADPVAVSGHHVQCLRREASVAERLGEHERRNRRDRRGLQNHRVAGGEGGAELVRHQVERIVEGSDRSDNADGKAIVVSHSVLRPGRRVEGNRLPIEPPCLVGGYVKSVGATQGFFPRLPYRLRSFRRDHTGELLVILLHLVRDLPENGDPLVCRNALHHFEAPHGARDCLKHILFVSRGDRVEDRPVVRVLYFDPLVPVDPLTADQHLHGSSSLF
jgi:hypothetical protein